MKNLGFMVTCYDEVVAIDVAMTSLRYFYPNAPVFLFCEKDEETFNKVCKKHSINQGTSEDTQSSFLKLGESNFTLANVEKVKHAINVFLNRVAYACDESGAEYMCLHCPDTLIRGELKIPEGSGLLGSCVNRFFKPETNDVLIRNGGIQVDYFGAVPAIFNVQDFYKAYHIITYEKPHLIKELAESWRAVFSYDILMPILFSLIGKKEEYNEEIVECERNSNWIRTDCPIVHQFRTFYPKRKTKYKSQEV